MQILKSAVSFVKDCAVSVKEFAVECKDKALMVATGVGATIMGLFQTAEVHAATVIDAATKTAISSGFTDLKDTLLDLLTTAFPFIIGASVIMMSPRIVKGLLRMAGK